jgi:hypothetical protein
MKQRLLGATLLAGLTGPALATGYNTIAIDNSAGSVGSLSITQDDSASNNTNTVSGNGSPSGTKLPVSGPWSTIAINQQNGGNTLKGSVKSAGSSTAASLTANYTGTTGSAGNVHTLNVGGTTAPLNPAVTVYAKNNGATANAITDTIDGASLSYNLGLLGTANSMTNTVSATTGGVTLTEGDSAYGIASSYGIHGDSNAIANTLTSGAGTVSVAIMVNGNSNSLLNTVTTTGGNISLTQGGSGYGINGDSNMITNTIGQSDHVGSFAQTLLVSGSNNTITNTVDSAGDKVVNQSLTAASSNNTINTTVSGGGTQTANLTLTNSSYLDYAITATASNTFADVTVTNVVGTGNAPAIVRVYQSTPNASLTTSSTGAAPGYTVTFRQ